MWKSTTLTISSDRVNKFSIFTNDRQLTYLETIDLWQNNAQFRLYFNSLLAKSSFTAFFWETPPINKQTINRLFEFVLIDSPRLATVNANFNSFKDYFNSASKEKQVITFPNLGNDALLVVPCPMKEQIAYPHMASFVRNATVTQQHLLWQTLGTVILERLSDNLMWISTSGLGVYWLHIRLDSYPKYYFFKPYKIY